MSDKSVSKSIKWFHNYPMPNWLSWFGLILLVSWIAYIIYISIIGEPKARKVQILEQEFSAIAPFPNSKLVEEYSSYKLEYVSASYVAPNRFENILAYYDEELTKNGWVFYGTSPVADNGGRDAYFCRDEYEAYIQYAGDQQGHYRWTYIFGLSYVSGGCEASLKGCWVKQTVPISLFFISLGIFLIFSGWYTAKEAWSRNSEDYLRLKFSKLESSRFGKWVSAMQKPSAFWSDRIGSIIMIGMGLFVFVLGLYSLWRNISSS